MKRPFLKLGVAIIALLGGASTQAIAEFDPITTFVLVAPKWLNDAKTLKDFHNTRQRLLPMLVDAKSEALAQFWLAETTRYATRYASTLTTPEAELVGIDLALLDADEAIRRYSLALDKDPKNAHAFFGRGSFYLERNAFLDKALQDFDAAIALDPKFAQAYLARALAQSRSFAPDADKVFADFSKAIALGIPTKGEDATYEKIIAPRLKAATHAGRGTIYLRQNLPDKALQDFNAALAAYPDALDARLARARVLAQKNQLDAALTDLNYLLQRAPDNAAAMAQRAEIYRVQNQTEKARSEMRRALQLDLSVAPSASSPIYKGLVDSRKAVLRGFGLYKQRAFNQSAIEEALAEYTKAIEYDEENVAAYERRARILMYTDLAIALSDIDKGLKLQPENVALITLRGEVIARQGKYDLALADLEKATRLAPDDVAAWEQIGIVQQAQGKYSQAEKSYDKAIGFAVLSTRINHLDSLPPLYLRRFIVIAAQGRDLSWKSEVEKFSGWMRFGLHIVEIEIKKQPDSKALQNLKAALTERAKQPDPTF